jgi:trans-aconitate 2-methyltransferase
LTSWDPGRYLEFEGHRLRPAVDLITRLGGRPGSIWDLGCGTGSITALLAERWPGAAVTGLDSSPDMLARARANVAIEWVEGDIATWEPGSPVDLIFSNAALHWITGHARLFTRLVGFLAEAGVLAVQMPRNFGEPANRLLAETALSPQWRERIGGVTTDPPVHEPDWYFDLLHPLVSDLDIWETVYQQRLEGESPVLRWTSGAAARPYTDALGADADAFLADYGARLAAAYPRRPDGSTLFSFRRLFIVARR